MKAYDKGSTQNGVTLFTINWMATDTLISHEKKAIKVIVSHLEKTFDGS